MDAKNWEVIVWNNLSRLIGRNLRCSAGPFRYQRRGSLWRLKLLFTLPRRSQSCLQGHVSIYQKMVLLTFETDALRPETCLT